MIVNEGCIVKKGALEGTKVSSEPVCLLQWCQFWTCSFLMAFVWHSMAFISSVLSVMLMILVLIEVSGMIK